MGLSATIANATRAAFAATGDIQGRRAVTLKNYDTGTYNPVNDNIEYTLAVDGPETDFPVEAIVYDSEVTQGETTVKTLTYLIQGADIAVDPEENWWITDGDDRKIIAVEKDPARATFTLHTVR